MRRIEDSARRHGVGRRAEIERGHDPCAGRMDRRRQCHMNVAAVVMVMAERGFAAVIGDINRQDGRRCVVARHRVVALTVVMVVSQVGRIFIGNAGELEAVFNSVLVVLHAMHLHRDHDGHAQADAEKAEQAWQIENSPIEFRYGETAHDATA